MGRSRSAGETLGHRSGVARAPWASRASRDTIEASVAAERSGDYHVEARGAGAWPAVVPVAQVAETVERLASELRGLASANLAPGALPELDEGFAALRRLEAAVAAVKARMVSHAARSRADAKAGLTDPTAYVRDRLGVSARQAKQEWERSQALEDLPAAARALADGRIGAEHVTVLGRAVREGRLGDAERTEDLLLPLADGVSPEQLVREVRRVEHAVDGDALRRDELRAHAMREVRIARRDDGMWDLRGQLDPLAGEKVATALHAFTTPDPDGTPHALRRDAGKRTADALSALVDAALSAGAPTTGGVRPHVSVVVPLSVLAEVGDRLAAANRELAAVASAAVATPLAFGKAATVAGNAAAPVGATAARRHGSTTGASVAAGVGSIGTVEHEIVAGPEGFGTGEFGTELSPDAVRRLLCDASVSRIVVDGSSQVLDVGRATRTWSPAQRRAAAARHGGCRGPGCERPMGWCHLHHVQRWSDGGPTDLANAIPLCERHHHLVHEGGWHLDYDPDSGGATFTSPTGHTITTLPRAPRPG